MSSEPNPYHAKHEWKVDTRFRVVASIRLFPWYRGWRFAYPPLFGIQGRRGCLSISSLRIQSAASVLQGGFEGSPQLRQC